MQRTIIFDLDDTLISTSLRQYNVITDFLKSLNIDFDVSYETYNQNRYDNRITNTEFFQSIVSEPKTLIAFRKYYLSNIESLEYLNFDELIVDLKLLEQLKKKYGNLMLLSLRSNYNNSLKQLENLHLVDFFNEIHFLPHADINPKIEKLRTIVTLGNQCVFIGDSEVDFTAAKMNKVDFIKVDTGLMKEVNLPEGKGNVNCAIESMLENGKI